MKKTMKRCMYDFTAYTHAENDEIWASSGVSTRRRPDNLTMAELDRLAEAYETTIEDMAGFAYAGMQQNMRDEAI